MEIDATVNSEHLWVRESGLIDPKSPRIVLLHGFSQTAISWSRLTSALAESATIATVDLPGHGRSHAISADLERSADLVAECGGAAVYVGYSMGGRVALHLALRFPHLVRGLILIGATAGVDDAHEREERRASDEVLATTISKDGVDTFLEKWLNGPLFQTLKVDEADLSARRSNTTEGLAMSLRRMGTGTQRPLWTDLIDLQIPTLVLAGELDSKFKGLGNRLVETIGQHAQLTLITGVGHAAHLENPSETLRHIDRFVADLQRHANSF